MDFRTEWSSWLLIVMMMIMSYFMAPPIQNGFIFLFQLIGYPFFTIAFATIPVLAYCYLRRTEPDIDYSIRTGFVLMVFFFVRFYI